VGGDVDAHAETYDEDKLSFFEIEGIVKKYGYKSGDMVYYLVPSCNMQSGLKLISSDYDVLGMVAAHKGVLVIELYLVSFAEHSVSNDEYEDNDEDNDGENNRIDRDDPYWEEVFEPDLFNEDSYPYRPSMVGAMLRAMLRGVMRVMGRVMRVRVGMKRVMSQWRVITKILMQRGLKERVEGVDVMVMRCMMMMLSPTWHVVTFLYHLLEVTRRMRFILLLDVLQGKQNFKKLIC
jgi:hypothetical protein